MPGSPRHLADDAVREAVQHLVDGIEAQMIRLVRQHDRSDPWTGDEVEKLVRIAAHELRGRAA